MTRIKRSTLSVFDVYHSDPSGRTLMISHIIVQMFSAYRTLTGKYPIKCSISPIIARELSSELPKGYLMANCVGSLTFPSSESSEEKSRIIGTFQGTQLIEDKDLLFGIQIIE